MSTANEDIIKEYQPVVDEMRRFAESKPRISILGKEFLIYSGVFHPAAWCDITEFINEEVVKVFKWELAKKCEDAPFHFLEVGTGAGYTAIFAALASQKSKVWATDINGIAVKNTIENAKLHGVDDRLTAVTADLFDHKEIAGKEFDMIYWDFPWWDQHTKPGNELEVLMRSVVDPGYQGLRRYLSQARGYLKKTASIFVAFSFTMGSKELFEKVVNETGWSYKICSRKIFLVPIGNKQNEEEICVVELCDQK